MRSTKTWSARDLETICGTVNFHWIVEDVMEVSKKELPGISNNWLKHAPGSMNEPAKKSRAKK